MTEQTAATQPMPTIAELWAKHKAAMQEIIRRENWAKKIIREWLERDLASLSPWIDDESSCAGDLEIACDHLFSRQWETFRIPEAALDTMDPKLLEPEYERIRLAFRAGQRERWGCEVES